MNLYISRKLRGLVSRKEVWREADRIRRLSGGDGVKFERATLLPLKRVTQWWQAQTAAVLAMKRMDGTINPMILYYICKEETRRLILIRCLYRKPEDLRSPDDAEEALPPKLKRALQPLQPLGRPNP